MVWEHQVPRVHRVVLVLRALEVTQDHQDLSVQLDLTVLLVCLVRQADLEQQVCQVNQDP